MFEKCGILDVFYAIKKGLVLIVASTLIGAIIGFALPVLSASEPPQDAIPESEYFVSSACFLIEADKTLSGEEDSLVEIEARKAESVTAIVKTDFTREKIYNKLLEKYSKEEIIEGFDLKCSADSLSSMHLTKALHGSVIWSTSISNIYVLGSNKALCDDYLEIAKTYLLEATDLVGNCTATYLDGISLNDVEKEAEIATNSLSFDKLWLIIAILGFVISVIAIVFKAIFFPTVNRRSDFADYGLNVLGEVSTCRKAVRK